MTRRFQREPCTTDCCSPRISASNPEVYPSADTREFSDVNRASPANIGRVCGRVSESSTFATGRRQRPRRRALRPRCRRVGMAFLVSRCRLGEHLQRGTADTMACGAPQRALLAVGAPVILLIGGLRAFFRTYQTWRRQETWWAWQGAGWFLLTLMFWS